MSLGERNVQMVPSRAGALIQTSPPRRRPPSSGGGGGSRGRARHLPRTPPPREGLPSVPRATAPPARWSSARTDARGDSTGSSRPPRTGDGAMDSRWPGSTRVIFVRLRGRDTCRRGALDAPATTSRSAPEGLKPPPHDRNRVSARASISRFLTATPSSRRSPGSTGDAACRTRHPVRPWVRRAGLTTRRLRANGDWRRRTADLVIRTTPPRRSHPRRGPARVTGCATRRGPSGLGTFGPGQGAPYSVGPGVHPADRRSIHVKGGGPPVAGALVGTVQGVAHRDSPRPGPASTTRSSCALGVSDPEVVERDPAGTDGEAGHDARQSTPRATPRRASGPAGQARRPGDRRVATRRPTGYVEPLRRPSGPPSATARPAPRRRTP